MNEGERMPLNVVHLLPWGRRCARAKCPRPRLLNATESEEVIQHRIAYVENYRKVSCGFDSIMDKENFLNIQHDHKMDYESEG